MWNKVEELYGIREAIGLSCVIGVHGASYAACRLKREKDDIDILERKTFDAKEGLIRYLKTNKQLPVALHLQGRGILLKEMPVLEQIRQEDILPVFPNYREGEYVFSYFAGRQKGWLALVRGTMLSELLSFFWEEDLALVQLYIGPFVADNILDQLNSYNEHFSFDGHHIVRSVEEKIWESYRYSAEERAAFTLKVQDTAIAEDYVQAYAAAFSLLMHRFLTRLDVDYPLVNDRLEEFRQQRKFKVNGLGLLLFFFVLLLINTVVYTHYSSAYEAMDSQHKENFSNANELEKLSEKAETNDSLLVALGWNGGLHKSWILNQLAGSLQGHQGVAWQSLSINPIASRRTGTTMGETDNRYKIQLTGTCETLNQLEGWTRNLSHQVWLSSVEISKFLDQNKPNSTLKDFVVTIVYKYDF
ncbi:hypothetical protein [Sphingobacterium sp. LRF_L2]|uniref:hypothetical protein n=1 Tax=Sphingobacterium sp. LRF_L2 TaxID=3369421 RepID=UPI003F5F431C